MTDVRERTTTAERHRPAVAPNLPATLAKPGAVRVWWGELTTPARVLVVVNSSVIAAVGALGAVLGMVP